MCISFSCTVHSTASRRSQIRSSFKIEKTQKSSNRFRCLLRISEWSKTFQGWVFLRSLDFCSSNFTSPRRLHIPSSSTCRFPLAVSTSSFAFPFRHDRPFPCQIRLRSQIEWESASKLERWRRTRLTTSCSDTRPTRSGIPFSHLITTGNSYDTECTRISRLFAVQHNLSSSFSDPRSLFSSFTCSWHRRHRHLSTSISLTIITSESKSRKLPKFTSSSRQEQFFILPICTQFDG